MHVPPNSDYSNTIALINSFAGGYIDFIYPSYIEAIDIIEANEKFLIRLAKEGWIYQDRLWIAPRALLSRFNNLELE